MLLEPLAVGQPRLLDVDPAQPAGLDDLRVRRPLPSPGRTALPETPRRRRGRGSGRFGIDWEASCRGSGAILAVTPGRPSPVVRLRSSLTHVGALAPVLAGALRCRPVATNAVASALARCSDGTVRRGRPARRIAVAARSRRCSDGAFAGRPVAMNAAREADDVRLATRVSRLAGPPASPRAGLWSPAPCVRRGRTARTGGGGATRPSSRRSRAAIAISSFERPSTTSRTTSSSRSLSRAIARRGPAGRRTPARRRPPAGSRRAARRSGRS